MTTSGGKKGVEKVVDPNQPAQVPSYPVSQPEDERDEEQKSSTRQKKYDGGEVPRTHSAKKAKSD